LKNLIKLTIAIFLLASNVSVAQNIKAYKSTLSYRQMPTELLPSNYQYYSTSIAIDPAFGRQMSVTESELNNSIDIGGFKKINNGGNFFIEIIYDLPLNNPASAPILNRESKSKKDDGTQVVTKYFWWQHDLAMPIALRVTDMNNEVIIDQIIRSPEEITEVKGKESTAYANALKGKKSSSRGQISSAYRAAILDGVQRANNLINNRYGFPIRKADPGLGVLAAKKHPEFAEWQTNMEAAKTAFSKLGGDKNSDQFRTEIQPIMSFWEAGYKANDKTNKKQRKLWYQSASNLMKSYYWMEDYENASKYANEIAGQKFKTQTGKGMLKRIEETKQSMANINASTRYFPIEIGEPSEEILNISYMGERQSKIDAYKDRAMGVNEGTREYNGSITTTQGQEFPVTFVVDYSRSLWLNFEAAGNVKFFREGETSVKREYLDVTKIKAFTFDNRVFKLMEFKPASAVKISLKKTIPAQYLEVIYEAEQIAVYHFYPSDLISMGGLKYLVLKKGLAQLFEDCSTLVKSIEAGNFKRSDESLKQLAIQFENDCLN